MENMLTSSVGCAIIHAKGKLNIFNKKDWDRKDGIWIFDSFYTELPNHQTGYPAWTNCCD